MSLKVVSSLPIKIGIAVLLSFATVMLLSVTIQRWSLSYNESGVYYDSKSMVTYDRDALEVYALLTILFLMITLVAGL